MATPLRAHGIEASLPAGFEGRIFVRPTVAGEAAYPVAHFATVPLSADAGDFGSGVVTTLGPSGIFVCLFEYGPESVGTALFAREGMPRTLAPSDFRTTVLRRGLGGQSGTQWFFTEAGRPFTLYVVLGSHVLRSALVPRVNDLIGAVAVSPTVAPDSTAVASPGGEMELIGLYLVACALLVGAGAVKAVRPHDTARALHALVPVGVPTLAVAVRIGAAVELAVGAVGAAFPGTATALAVAVSYAAFTVFVLVARSRGGAVASCGCFGTPDTPATGLHVAVDLVLSASAATVALSRPPGSITTLLAAQPAHGLPLLVVSGLGTWLTYLALSVLSSLQAARRLTGVTFDRPSAAR